MSARLGGALAPLLMVWVLSKLGATPFAFGVLAAIGLAWAGWFVSWFRDRPDEMRGVTRAEIERIERGRAPIPKGHRRGRISWRRLLGSPNVWALCLMYICLGFGPNFYMTMFPDYLRKLRGFDDQTASWIASAPLAFGVVGCVVGGWQSDRIIRATGNKMLGRRLVGALGLGLAAIPLTATLFVSDPIALAILHGLTFFGNDLAISPAWAACADIGEEHAGVLSGLMNASGGVVAAGWMFVVGRLLHNKMETTLFVALAAAYVLGSLMWLRIDASKKLEVE